MAYIHTPGVRASSPAARILASYLFAVPSFLSPITEVLEMAIMTLKEQLQHLDIQITK